MGYFTCIIQKNTSLKLIQNYFEIPLTFNLCRPSKSLKEDYVELARRETELAGWHCCICVCVVCRLVKIKEWVEAHDPGSTIIPFSGALELKLLDMETDAEREEYCKQAGTAR